MAITLDLHHGLPNVENDLEKHGKRDEHVYFE